MQSQNIALFILFSLAPAVAQGAKDQQCDTKECATDTGSLLMTNKIVSELSTDTELANKDNEGKMLVQDNCDESSWPDKDHGLVCGDCKVLVDQFHKYGYTCNGYCQAIGLQCKAQWEEEGDTCRVYHDSSCGDTIHSSDAICECHPPVPATTTAIPTTTTVAQNKASGCVGCETLMGIKEQLADMSAKVEAALKDCPEAPSPTPACGFDTSCPCDKDEEPCTNSFGDHVICFQGEPFEFTPEKTSGETTPTLINGYVKIPGGCCGAENQLNSQYEERYGNRDSSDESKAREFCDNNPQCVSFEIRPGFKSYGESRPRPYNFVGFSTSCNRNGFLPMKRLVKKYGEAGEPWYDGCEIDLFIKFPLRTPAGLRLANETDNYVRGTRGCDKCPEGSVPIGNYEDCIAARAEFQVYSNWATSWDSRTEPAFPNGCFFNQDSEYMYYNYNVNGVVSSHRDFTPVCKKSQ